MNKKRFKAEFIGIPERGNRCKVIGQIVLVRSAPKAGAARKPRARGSVSFLFLTRHSASQMRNRRASEKLRDRAIFGRPAGLEFG
jgi:hypothetical protein